MLTYNGNTWAEADLKTAHAVLVTQLLTSTSWASIDYMSGPVPLVAWLTVLEADRSKRPILDIMAEIQELPLDTLLSCIVKE